MNNTLKNYKVSDLMPYIVMYGDDAICHFVYQAMGEMS